MKTIHVHIPSAMMHPRPVAALLKAGTASSTSTTDADDDGGKWVTINGAHVHISDKGHIDKGPKELVGKSENTAHAEHHAQQSKAHSAAAQAKGSAHADTKLHQNASREHAMAAHHFTQSDSYAGEGNMNAAANNRRVAERHAAKAKEHGDELAKRNPQQTAPKKQAAADKPEAHKALHSDAEDDVKGSDKHEAEHKRLLGEYNKAGADWQRHAINNQISKNATDAVKAKADTAHKVAVAASAHAHNTDQIEHHKAAREAIDKALEARERAGMTTEADGKGKGEELQKMRTKHHAKVMAHERENPTPTAGRVSHSSTLEGAAALQQKSEYPTQVFKHQGKFFVPTNAKESGRFKRAGYEVALDYNGKPPGGKKADDGHKPPAPAPSPAPVSPGHGAKSSSGHSVFRSNRSGSSGNSALGRMAARVAKKAAEEAADQDPKHRK